MNLSVLTEFLEKRGALSINDKEIISSIFYLKNVKKGNFLLRKDEICDEIYFITKGLLRAYYFTDKGLEFTRLVKKETEFCSNL